jgi:dolichyl-phosphate beta-glucosyltransferase
MLDTALVQYLLEVVAVLLSGGLVFLFYPAIVTAASDRNSDMSSRNAKPQTILASSNNEEQPPLLTLVIPAYEEEVRLPSMLQEAYTYLTAKKDGCRALQDLASLSRGSSDSNTSANRNKPHCVEWIVVNDGSKDRTSAVYRDFIQKLPASNNMTWKLIGFPQNCGKGAAVQAGMLAATGDFCLMVDADGATDFGPGLEALTGRLVELMHNNNNKDDRCSYPILLGSRAHLHNSTTTTDVMRQQRRSFVRSFLMQAFHVCVVVFVGAADICDTQCGFKLFARETASHLFRMLHLRRWAFDTELLYLATHLNYSLQEVVVPWQEIEGSKLHTSALNLALVSVSMLRDMVCVRLCYTLGLWKIRRKAQ